MAGMDSIAVTRQEVAAEVQKKQAKGAVKGAAAKAGEALSGCGFGPPDGFVPKCLIAPRPPEPFICTLPPWPPRDPKAEARDLVYPVVRRTGAAQLEAYQKFTEQVTWTSTAGLKEALKLLDTVSVTLPRIPLPPPFEDPNHKVIQLLRKGIETELKSRPKNPEDEARAMINDVTGASGAQQLRAYVKFAGELKHASRAVLEEARDQLVDRMANESDREQRLIYKLLLHAVNNELDNRNTRPQRRGPGADHRPAFYLGKGQWTRPTPLDFPDFPSPSSAPAFPLRLSLEEQSLLKSKLDTADAGTRTAIKAMIDTKE